MNGTLRVRGGMARGQRYSRFGSLCVAVVSGFGQNLEGFEGFERFERFEGFSHQPFVREGARGSEFVAAVDIQRLQAQRGDVGRKVQPDCQGAREVSTTGVGRHAYGMPQ